MNDEMMTRVRQAAEALKAAGAREVYLFGSAAQGRFVEGSDIDLAVSGLPPERFFSAMGQAADILDCEVDLVDLGEENLFTAYLKNKGHLRHAA